jgi:hypothetical protein
MSTFSYGVIFVSYLQRIAAPAILLAVWLGVALVSHLVRCEKCLSLMLLIIWSVFFFLFLRAFVFPQMATKMKHLGMNFFLEYNYIVGIAVTNNTNSFISRCCLMTHFFGSSGVSICS